MLGFMVRRGNFVPRSTLPSRGVTALKTKSNRSQSEPHIPLSSNQVRQRKSRRTILQLLRVNEERTRPVTTLKTAWIRVREKANVVGRWHDNRHTLVTELAESGAGDEVIMSIAGHVSRAMLSRYSHVRMEAKRSTKSRPCSDGRMRIGRTR
jgi:integrase-like protein